MAYLGTKPANQVIDSTLIADGTVTPADLSTGKPVWDTSGNVGIGTSSPNTKLETVGTMRVSRSGSPGTYMEMFGGSGVLDPYINVPSGFGVPFQIGGTERMRIDSSGNLLVGITSFASASDSSNPSNTAGLGLSSQTSGGVLNLKLAGTNGTIVNFARGGVGNVGRIDITTTATSYVTSSDYRLKENIAPMTGALGVVQQLKPVTYNWKIDGSQGQGFIAHELQAVVPDCVTGEKDAVDAEGKPVYQGIDTSFLVATLTAAIQEQQAIIQSQADTISAMEARLTALEAK